MQNLFKRQLSRSSSSSAVHYVIVGVGNESFGVPASQIHEILGLGDMDPTPRLPKQLAGPVRLVGKMIFLIKLQLPFTRPKVEAEVGPSTCVLVLKGHSSVSTKIAKGVVVDRVEKIISLDEQDIETFATRRKDAWSAFTLGFISRQMPIVLFDLDRLTSENDGGESDSPTGETATSRLKRRQNEAK